METLIEAFVAGVWVMGHLIVYLLGALLPIAVIFVVVSYVIDFFKKKS